MSDILESSAVITVKKSFLQNSNIKVTYSEFDDFQSSTKKHVGEVSSRLEQTMILLVSEKKIKMLKTPFVIAQSEVLQVAPQ